MFLNQVQSLFFLIWWKSYIRMRQENNNKNIYFINRLMQNSNVGQKQTNKMNLNLRKEESGQNMMEAINNAIPGNLSDSQKQNNKEQKVKIVEKTQRIKKQKKEKKHFLKNQHYTKAEIQTFESEIIKEAVDRLRNSNANSSEEGSLIHKKLTRQRLLQFLQLIEQEYNRTIGIYLQSNINKQLSGNLKSLLFKYIDHIIQAFPVLNNIIYRYAFQYYKTGPLQYQFNKLMEKTITPILNHASQQFLHHKQKDLPNNNSKTKIQIDNNSTQISKSPEREFLDDFQEQNKKKLQKKKRKKTRKMQQKEKNQESMQQNSVTQQIKVQPALPRQYQQLNALLEGLTLLQNRIECRIEQKYLSKWKNAIQGKQGVDTDQEGKEDSW